MSGLLENPRKYGQAPFCVAVVHGGPEAAGEIAPVARELATARSILEPLQTATSLDGQVEELDSLLADNARAPFTLVGHSWGAWLALIVAARYPAVVSKLILVGSGPFQEDPIQCKTPGDVMASLDGAAFAGVWRDAAALRRSGRLLQLAGQVRCPVLAIHGDWDPHPIAGVREPLSGVLESFRFVVLPKRGHTPWLERQASGRFFSLLEQELP